MNTASDAEYLIALLTEVESSDQPLHHKQAELESHKGLPRILDTMATIFISKPKGEVIAVGFQPGNEKGTLTLASNEDTVPDATLKHAREILNRLQEIGQWLASPGKSVRRKGNKDKNEESEIVNEDLFPEPLRGKVSSFRVAIHAFSQQKSRQKLEKPCGETTCVGAFIEYVESLSDDTECNEVVKRLQIISHVLGWVMDVYDDNSGRIPDAEMLKFVDGMNYIFFTVKELWKIEH